MDILSLAAIAVASGVNQAIPGPALALTVGRAAGGGARSGALVASGSLVANLILCAIAFAIIKGLMVLSPAAYTALTWIGIAALLLLALRILRSSSKPAAIAVRNDAKDHSFNLIEGLMVGLSSPFNLIFLLAVLPQFVPATSQTIIGFGFATAAVLVGAAVSLTAAILLTSLCCGKLPRFSGQIERLGGWSMIGFAGLASMTAVT